MKTTMNTSELTEGTKIKATVTLSRFGTVETLTETGTVLSTAKWGKDLLVTYLPNGARHGRTVEAHRVEVLA